MVHMNVKLEVSREFLEKVVTIFSVHFFQYCVTNKKENVLVNVIGDTKFLFCIF